MSREGRGKGNVDCSFPNRSDSLPARSFKTSVTGSDASQSDWEDFVAGGKHEAVLKSEGEIPTKFVGQIEQVICSGGRIFIATPSSTFSGFVPRLRGYMGVPDTAVYYNTHAYWGPIEENPKVRGTDFYREYPALW